MLLFFSSDGHKIKILGAGDQLKHLSTVAASQCLRPTARTGELAGSSLAGVERVTLKGKHFHW